MNCLLHAHTTVTLRAWAIWRHAHPFWHARTTALACTRAAILALPLALPGAAFAPHVTAPTPIGAAFSPFASGGSLLASGQPLGWEALPRLSASSPHHPASLTADVPQGNSVSAWANPASQQTTRARPELLTFGAPLDVPIWLPDRAEGGTVPVPEPAGWGVLVLAVLVVVWRRVRGA